MTEIRWIKERLQMDPKYMRHAIELAKRGEGRVSPNPMVGCVVVKDDVIIAEGWHDRYGGYHAERNALTDIDREVSSGADLYVTLEPCCHHGKTPPCTDIIMEKGIKRVFVGSDDPNPLVAGGGFRVLREAGIEVYTHVLKEECDAINEVFFHYITTKLPFVVTKYAMTLDGKITLSHDGISDRDGETPGKAGSDDPVSRTPWQPAGGVCITGDKAHAHVHALRRRYSSIMVGVGTVISDDPMLDYRPGGESVSGETQSPGQDKDNDFDYNPVRIIADTHLRTPLTSRIVKTAGDIPTIIAYADDTGLSGTPAGDSLSQRASELEAAGVRLMAVEPDERGHICLRELLKKLGDEGIDSVLVEGGSALHGSFLDERLINRVYAYISPKLFGGETALTPIGGTGVSDPGSAMRLTGIEVISLGEDICVTGVTQRIRFFLK